MNDGMKGISRAEARVTRLPDALINRSPAKSDGEPAKVIEFQPRRTTAGAANIEQREKTARYKAMNDAISAQNLQGSAEGASSQPSEQDVQEIVRGLSTALANLRSSGRIDDVLVHNLDPLRVRELLED